MTKMRTYKLSVILELHSAKSEKRFTLFVDEGEACLECLAYFPEIARHGRSFVLLSCLYYMLAFTRYLHIICKAKPRLSRQSAAWETIRQLWHTGENTLPAIWLDSQSAKLRPVNHRYEFYRTHTHTYTRTTSTLFINILLLRNVRPFWRVGHCAVGLN